MGSLLLSLWHHCSIPHPHAQPHSFKPSTESKTVFEIFWAQPPVVWMGKLRPRGQGLGPSHRTSGWQSWFWNLRARSLPTVEQGRPKRGEAAGVRQLGSPLTNTSCFPPKPPPWAGAGAGLLVFPCRPRGCVCLFCIFFQAVVRQLLVLGGAQQRENVRATRRQDNISEISSPL